jgi:hypothetical protein
MPPEQLVDKVWGDSSEAGEPFVIRIHNHAGSIVLPHVEGDAGEDIVVGALAHLPISLVSRGLEDRTASDSGPRYRKLKPL